MITNARSKHWMGRECERGSSMLEFIFCAPLLLIMIFIAMEINERIEHRVTSTIAAANAAWIINPEKSSLESETTTQVQALVTADILGTRVADHKNILGLRPGARVANGQTVMSYTETKRQADAYAARITHQTDVGATDRAEKRASSSVGDSKWDHVASNLGLASATLNGAVRTLTDPQVKWLPSTFPAKDIEEQRLTWRISKTGTTNLALSTIEALAQSLHGGSAADLQDATSPEYRILAHHSGYLRRYAAYHPSTDEYRSEMLVGLIIGSNAYDGFVTDCFMKFKTMICGQTNGFVSYVRNIHLVLTTVKTLVDSAAIACVAASIGTGAGACMIPTGQVAAAEVVLKRGIEATIKDVITVVTGSIEKAIKDSVGKAVNDLNGPFKRNIAEFRNKVATNAEQILNDEGIRQ